ncbi:hypothetical protein [Streptomyces sulfonofaciens]|nr:hypothetical protein [Streptomyces sulfonofaciens]
MDRSLLSTRAALVCLLAVLVGLGAGLLSVCAGDAPARGVLCGLAAAGAAVPVFNQAITPEAGSRGRTAGRPSQARRGDGRG